MFSDCGEMMVLKSGGGQATLGRSFTSMLAAACGVCLTAGAIWGMRWAINRHEIVLIASVLLAGGAAAAYTVTALWLLAKNTQTLVDVSGRSLTLSSRELVSFADISHIEVRPNSRDFCGQDVTSYMLCLVPVKGSRIELASGDGPARVRKMGAELAKLIGRPLRDMTQE